MASQQIQFYQYRPDSDARHNAVFTPMPTEQPVYSPMVAYPHHAYAHPQYWHQPHYQPQPHFVPRPMHQTQSPPLTLTMPMPRIVVDQRGQMDHLVQYRHSSPPTPSLSACPSTASSPPASTVHPTPTHGAGYFTLPIEQSKDEMATLPLMEDWTEAHGQHYIMHSCIDILTSF